MFGTNVLFSIFRFRNKKNLSLLKTKFCHILLDRMSSEGSASHSSVPDPERPSDNGKTNSHSVDKFETEMKLRQLSKERRQDSILVALILLLLGGTFVGVFVAANKYFG